MRNSKKIHLLFGVGEVGTALKQILIRKTQLYWFDTNPHIKDNLPSDITTAHVLHITFPQDKKFILTIRRLIDKYTPELTVIHSTTIPGTCEQLGKRVVHSPILGQHDSLYRHVKTFRKAIGANSLEGVKLSKKYLGELFKLQFYKDSKTTEAAKVLSLAKFAISIEFARYSKEFCHRLRVDYDEVYTKFSKLYNDGYAKNRMDQFIQPILYPPAGKIGGRCVNPGVQKARDVLSSDLNEILKK